MAATRSQFLHTVRPGGVARSSLFSGDEAAALPGGVWWQPQESKRAKPRRLHLGGSRCFVLDQPALQLLLRRAFPTPRQATDSAPPTAPRGRVSSSGRRIAVRLATTPRPCSLPAARRRAFVARPFEARLPWVPAGAVAQPVTSCTKPEAPGWAEDIVWKRWPVARAARQVTHSER